MVIDPESTQSLRRVPIAVIDFETTWEDNEARSQHPVSVAVVHAQLGVIGSERVAFKSLIRPAVPIRPEATEIHGVTDEMVKGQKSMEDTLGDIYLAIDGRVLAAYNLPFDWGILSDFTLRTGHKPIPFGALDPLTWAKVTDAREKGKKLSQVCSRRGIVFNAHNAEEDAMATARVMPLLLRDLKKVSTFPLGALDTVGDIWKWTKKAAIEWEESYAKYRHRQQSGEPDMPWKRFLNPES